MKRLASFEALARRGPTARGGGAGVSRVVALSMPTLAMLDLDSRSQAACRGSGDPLAMSGKPASVEATPGDAGALILVRGSARLPRDRIAGGAASAEGIRWGDMTPLLSVLLFGFFLGMRHATDADHVI